VALTGVATALPAPASAAPVFADGFERGDLSAWTGSAGFATQQLTVRSGAWAGRATSTGAASHAWRTFTSQSELWSRTAFAVTSRSTAVWLVSFRRSGGGAVLLVGLNKGGKLIARNAASGTTYTSSTVVSTGGWHDLQVHAKTGSGGLVDVTLDGTAVGALSRSTNLGSGAIGRLTVGDSSTGRRFTVAFDDVSVSTDTGPQDTTAPTQPAGLVAGAVDPTTIDLSWQPSTDDVAVTGYTIYRSLDGSTYTSVSTTSSLTHRATGLQPDTTYWWAVEAADAAGNRSPRSDPATATTPTVPDEGDPAVVGRWSAPFEVGVAGVHASLLHTGKVMLFYETSATTGNAMLWDSGSGSSEPAPLAVTAEHDLWCSGHAIRPDGDLFVTGGTLWGSGPPNGTEQTAFFDPLSETWSVGPSMAQKRWYPTDVSLPDGDVLVFAGKVRSGVNASDVERYDGETGAFSTLPASATRDMAFYPRMFILPDGRIVRVGQERQTVFFEPASSSWTTGPPMTFGARTRGSAVMLPGAQEILAIGGATQTGATATAEILDLRGSQPVWRPTGSMHDPRRNLNAVLLPDGKVMAIGGNRGVGDYEDPVFRSELFDPATGRWSIAATQTAPRAYHSTALLLPDGRVLSAGQSSGPLQTTAEIYSPPYLFAGPRPVIDEVPSAISYGSTLEVATSQASSIDDVVLIRAGTVTHGVNFDQRSVDLPFAAGQGTLNVTAPRSNMEAPPGWYMLFLVDAGVPSVARWVHVA
jgi:hypothetical protein